MARQLLRLRCPLSYRLRSGTVIVNEKRTLKDLPITDRETRLSRIQSNSIVRIDYTKNTIRTPI